MKKFFGILILSVLIVTGCDLQPHIASIPDSVGDFISTRYPTLLAEPDSEIYKTAVADYGVYASPTLYGDGDVMAQDYVLYSPVDDYMMPAQDTHVDDADAGMPVEEDDDGYAPDTDVDDLWVPDYVNEKPVVEEKKSEPKPESKVEPKSETKTDAEPELLRAQLNEITVEKGDTLYSLSRRYSVPVNDLAVMNKISAPFALSVGQKIKVPDVLSVPQKASGDSVVRVADKKVEPQQVKVATKAEASKKTEPVKVEPKKVEPQKKTTEEKSKSKAASASVKPVSTVAASGATPKAKTVDVKKTEVKKAETKKADVKKTDAKSAKKTDVKKAESKKVDTKKSDAKKTEVKKSASAKSQSTKQTKQREAQKMVARSSSKFSWPVRGKILSGYGSKSNGLFNDGINIKAARGATVAASENGFVAYAGNEVKGMGNLVIIQHADGWMTVYAHMESMSVRRGHGVSVGQKIGTVGTSGKVDQPQLHFEIRKGTKAYNPVNYLKK